MLGERFGRLVVVDKVRRRDGVKMRFYYVCRCDCGVLTLPIRLTHLRSGHTSSCGCRQREVVQATGLASRHGHARREDRSPTYGVWQAMLGRCRQEGREHYHDKGIRVCERWHTFENFLADMGERPEGLTIDRKDNDRDYEPGNCRWATWSEQRCNQDRNH